MELLLCLALVLLLRLLAEAVLPSGKAGHGALAPTDMPLRVHQAIRRSAQGIAIRTVHVEMDGADTVRYTVCGTMPDGRQVTLAVHGNGEVSCPDMASECGELPPQVRRRLLQCMPSFHPDPATLRRVSGSQSVWYEIDGEVSDGLPVGVKISHDGHDLLMTVSEERMALPPGAHSPPL